MKVVPPPRREEKRGRGGCPTRSALYLPKELPHRSRPPIDSEQDASPKCEAIPNGKRLVFSTGQTRPRARHTTAMPLMGEFQDSGKWHRNAWQMPWTDVGLRHACFRESSSAVVIARPCWSHLEHKAMNMRPCDIHKPFLRKLMHATFAGHVQILQSNT